ncbi:hypothetical protein BH11ARM2_BH11ARM2_03210 [soil metagenome]
MPTTKQRSFRLPLDVNEHLEAVPNASEYVVQAIREKFERDEIERFRQSARRIAALPPEENEMEWAIPAFYEVLLVD